MLRRGSAERLSCELLEGQVQGERLIAHLDGINDRDAASALTGAVVEVQRAELPPPGRRQHYQADLIGLTVRNAEGAELGQVAQFVEAPGGPVMVVKARDGREHWVLATPEYLRKVELDNGLIMVDWPLELE